MICLNRSGSLCTLPPRMKSIFTISAHASPCNIRRNQSSLQGVSIFHDLKVTSINWTYSHCWMMLCFIFIAGLYRLVVGDYLLVSPKNWVCVRLKVVHKLLNLRAPKGYYLRYAWPLISKSSLDEQGWCQIACCYLQWSWLVVEFCFWSLINFAGVRLSLLLKSLVLDCLLLSPINKVSVKLLVVISGEVGWWWWWSPIVVSHWQRPLSRWAEMQKCATKTETKTKKKTKTETRPKTKTTLQTLGIIGFISYVIWVFSLVEIFCQCNRFLPFSSL